MDPPRLEPGKCPHPKLFTYFIYLQSREKKNQRMYHISTYIHTNTFNHQDLKQKIKYRTETCGIHGKKIPTTITNQIVLNFRIDKSYFIAFSTSCCIFCSLHSIFLILVYILFLVFFFFTFEFLFYLFFPLMIFFFVRDLFHVHVLIIIIINYKVDMYINLFVFYLLLGVLYFF